MLREANDIKSVFKYLFILFFSFIFLIQANATIVETYRAANGTYATRTMVYTNSPSTYVPTDWNSTTNYNYTNWNAGSNLGQPASTYGVNNAPRIVCPVNYTINGSTCVANKKTCRDGQIVSVFEECLKTCWGGVFDGKRINENLTCIGNQNSNNFYGDNNSDNTNSYGYTNNNNSYTRLCKNGTRVSSGEVCEKVCASGAYVSEDEACPTQIKICNSGKVIAYNAVCTKRCDNGSLINEYESCGNSGVTVSTSLSSKITSSSARCNAVALIPSKIDAMGYFEYSKAASMYDALKTNEGIFKGSNKYNFANTIINLDSDTKYYCRAVLMVNNNIYKGETVSFKTLAGTAAVNPNTETVIKEVKTTVVKTETKKAANIQTNQNKLSESKIATSTGVANQKDDDRVGLSLVRVSDKIRSGGDSIFKLLYSNNSDEIINNYIIEIKTPNDFIFVSSTNGDYDGEDKILTISTKDLLKNYKGENLITYKLRDGVISGTNIIINVQATYEDINGDKIDKNAYLISTVSSGTASVGDSASTKDEGIFSNTLFKFLIILILILILIIIGRDLYKRLEHKRVKARILNSGSSHKH